MTNDLATQVDAPAVIATRWAAVHVYCHAESDRLIREGLRPAIDEIRSRGLVDRWFFVRYWHGGPHLRVRLHGADDDLGQALRILSERLNAALAEIVVTEPLDPDAFYAGFRTHGDLQPDEEWADHGSIVERPYEPELDRYGGPEAMAASENLFQVSSDVVLAAVAATTDEQMRSAIALDLFRGLVAGMYEDDSAAQVTWLREYATMWQFLDGTVERSATAVRAAAETTFVSTAAHLVDDARSEPSGASLVWRRSVGRLVAWLREQDGLSTSPDAVLVSQMHMTANRLGLTASDEYYLAWLASLAIAAPQGSVDYFEDGTRAPDRAYQELSKFRAPLMRSQVPTRTGPTERTLEFPRGAPVGLPLPAQPELARPFVEVLGQRRSHRDGYEGTEPLALDDLAALLGYGTGFVAEDRSGGSGRGVRAHPSAGMSYATFVRVAVFDVDGLAPGLYEYLPYTHELQNVGAAPSRDDLLDGSPFFFRGDDPAIRADEAPAFVAVGASLGAMRSRYGLRALRFAHLEVGHLTQNIILTAAALGVPSVPIGGFYDDHIAGLMNLDGYSDIVLYLLPIGRRPARAHSMEEK